MEENIQELKKPEEKDIKSEAYGFLGGIDINLARPMKDGSGILADKLSTEINKQILLATEEHETLIERLGKCDRQYHGIKPEKNSPHPKCSNTAIPISRSGADAIHVRTMDRIFNQFKVYLIKAKKPELVDVAPLLEDALNWWVKYSKFKQKLLSPLLESIISGTGITKIPWVRKPRAAVRYATPKEIADKTKNTFRIANSNRRGIKPIQTQYDGPDIEGIPRKDFIISPEAKTIEEAHLVGFKTYLRRPDVELRVNQGLWYKNALDELKVPDEFDETEKARVEQEGKELKSELKEPFEIWELWFAYDVDEDGEADDIVVTYHQPSQTILRAIYNPFFSGFRPFVAFKGFPRKYGFDGEGVSEILEQLAETIDTLYNQTVDRLTLINSPMTIGQEGRVPTDLIRAPGKLTIVEGDIDAAIKVIPEPGVYPATLPIIQSLVGFAREAIGITQDVLGMPTAERPVARETLARLQEANKKFLYISDNDLDVIENIGWKVLEEIAQHSPTYTYYEEVDGELKEKTVDFPSEYLRDGLDLQLSASKEMMSQEMRREVSLTKYQLTSDAATKLFGMLQMATSGQLPEIVVQYIWKWMGITERYLEAILRDFDEPDSKGMIADTPTMEEISKGIAETQAKMQQQMQQAMAMQAQQTQQEAQTQQGGQPQTK